MKHVLKHLEIPALIFVPLILILCMIFQFSYNALLMLLVVMTALIIFLANFEFSKPSLRQFMPIVVLSALATAGRIVFAPVANFKPVSAICIVSGVVFGRRTGFMVGVLSALVSNFFFGQGPWTPWQMYAWGMVGYLAGVLSDHGWFKHPVVLYGYGFVSALLYSFILNTYYLVGFVHPLTWQSAALAYGASLMFDLIHGVATVIFLFLIYAPWQKKLERIKRKYELVR